MKLSKEIRLISIGVLLLLSLGFLIYPLIIQKSGVVVVSVADESTCDEILIPGVTVTSVNGEKIGSSSDFYSATSDLSGRVNLIVNDGPRVCTIEGNNTIDVQVRDFERESIKYGIDVKGGKKLILEAENPEEAVSIINSRVRSYGITNLKVQEISKNQLNLVFGSENQENIESLLQPGIVSAKLLKVVELENKTGELLLNNQPYEFDVTNDTLNIENNTYQINDGFSLEGVEIEIQNITQNYTGFYLNVFDDRDVDTSTIGQNKRVFQNQGKYVFVFEVGLSDEASENFAKITEGQPVTINPQGENYLRDPLVILVDGEIITSVPVSSSDAGKEIEIINIWGVENTGEEANRKLQLLTTFLKSGRLTDVEIVERGEAEPESGELINYVIYITLGILVASGIYSFLKYKNIQIAGLAFGIFVSEALLFLGVVSSQVLATLLLAASVVFTAAKGRVKDWFKWLSLLLVIVIGFGAIVNRLIVDSYTLYGFTFGLLISLGYFVLLNEKLSKSRKKYEKFLEVVWKVSFVLLLGLAIIFFLQTYKNFSIAATITLMTSLMLTKPEYARLVKKLKGR